MHGLTLFGRRLGLGSRSLGALALFALLSLTASCKQGENERCSIDADCADDYYCYYGSGTDKIIGGTCRSRTATNTPQDLSTPAADMSQPPDLANTDM